MVIPSILENDFTEIQIKIKEVESVAQTIQIDVLDGTAFNNTTFHDMAKLSQISTYPAVQIHLMVANPLKYLAPKTPSIDTLFIEYECCNPVDIDTFLIKATGLGYKTGLSIGPYVESTKLERYLNKIQYVQFMTIDPGKQGNPFKPETLDKIREFRKKHSETIIQADGGINKGTMYHILKSGVDNVVIGSAIFNSIEKK